MKKKNDSLKKTGKFEKFQNSTLLTVSCLVILILLVAVTVTWYVFDIRTGTNGLSLKISEWDFIVSKTPGGDPIGNSDTLDLSIDELSNISDKMIAPGTTGTITLYVRTTTDMVTNCTIRLNKNTLTLKVSDDMDYSEILSEHFYFYSDAEMTTEVSMDSPINIDLQKNVEKEVKIYWKWPYDGSELIPDTITDEQQIEEFLKKYDDEDCIISEYQDSIAGSISFQISGSSKNPETTNS